MSLDTGVAIHVRLLATLVLDTRKYPYLWVCHGHAADADVGVDPIVGVGCAFAVPRGGVELVVPDVLAEVSGH